MNDAGTAAVNIIRAGILDVARIAPLFDAYRGFYGQSSNVVSAQAFLRDRLINDESVIFLALVGLDTASAAPAGFTQLYPVFSSIRMGRKWILNDLFVASEFRRLGVGRRLMERSIAFARETRARGLELSTGIENTNAQQLYEALQFKRDTQFHRYELNFD
jgi:GNAT superfamily N-acetyltransferase